MCPISACSCATFFTRSVCCTSHWWIYQIWGKSTLMQEAGGGSIAIDITILPRRDTGDSFPSSDELGRHCFRCAMDVFLEPSVTALPFSCAVVSGDWSILTW